MKVFGCIFGFLLIWGASTPAMGDTIVLAADRWCPFNCSPQDKNPGFLVELSRLVYEKAGHRLEYRLMPWKRAVADGKAGWINGVIGFTKKKVPGFKTTRSPLFVSQEVFFVRKNSSWRYTGVHSLSGLKRIGFPNGYHYSKEIDAYISGGDNVYLVPGSEPLKAMVKMLHSSRIQAFPGNRSVVEYYLKQHDMVGKLIPAGEYSRSPIFIGFGLTSTTYARDEKILSDGFDLLRRDGRYAEMAKKYGLISNPQ